MSQATALGARVLQAELYVVSVYLGTQRHMIAARGMEVCRKRHRSRVKSLQADSLICKIPKKGIDAQLTRNNISN